MRRLYRHLVALIPLTAFALFGQVPSSALAHAQDNKAAAVIGEQISRPDPDAPAVKIGGPYTLIDQNGHVVTDATYHGSYQLVFFGFTYCPDICPTGLQTMITALSLLPAPVAEKVQPILITVDPARDTVEKMKEYAAMFSPRLVALTGTETQIAAVAKAYKVYYTQSRIEGDEDEEAYTVNHTSFYYLMNPDGSYKTIFAPDIEADAMAKQLNDIVK